MPDPIGGSEAAIPWPSRLDWLVAHGYVTKKSAVRGQVKDLKLLIGAGSTRWSGSANLLKIEASGKINFVNPFTGTLRIFTMPHKLVFGRYVPMGIRVKVLEGKGAYQTVSDPGPGYTTVPIAFVDYGDADKPPDVEVDRTIWDKIKENWIIFAVAIICLIIFIFLR